MMALLLSWSLEVRFEMGPDEMAERLSAVGVTDEGTAQDVYRACKEMEPYMVGAYQRPDELGRLLDLMP